MPLDEFARRILTARGGAVDDPASVYFAISKDTNDTVERVDAGLLRRAHAVCPLPHASAGELDAGRLLRPGQLLQPGERPARRALPERAEQQARAAEPGGRARRPTRAAASRSRRSSSAAPSRSSPPDADRREAYAHWLTAPENPFFARGLVNRIWSYFFHRGIIEPVDDMRSTNPPINPALLDALTKDFVEHQLRRAAPDAADRHLGRPISGPASPTPSNRARRAELLARHPAPRPGRGAARFAGPGDRRAGELRRRPGRLPRRPAARRQRRERRS